ncbi:hypothetical protein BT69DRAFT_265196 [Atractiella rhizophila]|nr:hypothetical protein BT69DRAFT_265196 [Atractiella rhizophila]
MMADNDAVGKKGAKKQAGAKAPEAQPAPSAPAPAKKSALASQLQDITFRIQSPVNSPKPQPLDSPSMGVLDGKKKIDISTKTWSPKAAPHLGSGLNGINMGSPLLRSNRGTPTFQPLDSGGGDRMGELRNEMKTLEAVLSAAVVQQNSPRVSPPRSSFSSPLSPRSPAARTPLFSPRSRAESVVDEDESGANDKGLFGDNNGWGKQAGASGSGVRVEDDTRVEEEAARIVAEAEAAKAAAEAAAVEAARRAEEEESRRRARKLRGRDWKRRKRRSGCRRRRSERQKRKRRDSQRRRRNGRQRRKGRGKRKRRRGRRRRRRKRRSVKQKRRKQGRKRLKMQSQLFSKLRLWRKRRKTRSSFDSRLN